MPLRLLTVSAVLSLCACGSAEPEAPVPPPAAAAPAPAPAQMPAPARAAPAAGHIGAALEVLEGGGYTYVRMQDGEAELWIAGPKASVSVGDVVRVAAGSPMQNFNSPTLKRTFPSIEFVSAIEVGTATRPVPATVHSGAPPARLETTVEVAKLADGLTVAEVWAGKEGLGGKQIALRATVVKYSPGIMDTNFMHVQDGSGSSASGTHDLTVTTQGVAAVGDVVVLRGTLALNRDYGMGYTYPVLLDEASIQKD